tara:strand:+ start:344 stop:826 length:483 start_codon:yes stop_codon:yes gene_type:complete
MIKKFNILILSMFAVGRSKYAPGTVASFITCLVFIPLYGNKINIIFLIIIISFFFIYSVYAIDRFKNYFDEVDSREIVIDEFVGQSIPIITIYSLITYNISNFIFYTVVSFFLFRFFDIIKPYPINKIDKNIKNGFGVMLDDVVAGIYSSIVLIIFILLI